jgi:outer membrane receptor for Fe3+-dicitrate
LPSLTKTCVLSLERLNGKKIIPFLFMLFFSNLLLAQGTVQGRITSGDSALANVTVQVKGSSTATQTDNNGNFRISASPGATLVLSAVGFTTQEVKVDNRGTVNVDLASAATQLEQIVVVGYGTQRRATVTGAIANVSGKTVAELPVPNIGQALQGRVAGVQVTNNGSPGTQPIVQIRGISS